MLKKIIDISAECASSTSSEENEDEIEIFQSDQSRRKEESSDSEEENVCNIHHSRKKVQVPSDSKSENDTNITRLYQSFDAGYDTEIWKKLKVSGSAGRPPIHIIFKDTAGCTGCA